VVEVTEVLGAVVVAATGAIGTGGGVVVVGVVVVDVPPVFTAGDAAPNAGRSKSLLGSSR